MQSTRHLLLVSRNNPKMSVKSRKMNMTRVDEYNVTSKNASTMVEPKAIKKAVSEKEFKWEGSEVVYTVVV